MLEHDVVDVLELALVQVEGVRAIRSTCRQGSANITLELELTRDVDLALQAVQTQVAQAQRRLPRDRDPPVVGKTNPEDQPIMWIGVAGAFPRQFLSDFTRYRLKERLQGIPGVGEVTMGGFRERNVRLWLDARKLDQVGMTVADVTGALALAVGIVMDDAIMVLENIVRHAEGGKPRRQAALEGTEEIAFAALAATVAVVAIFIPVGGVRVGKFTAGGRRVDIRLRLLASQRTRPEDLNVLKVRTGSGQLVPLSALARFDEIPELQAITRRDRDRAISVFANVATGRSQEQALEAVEEIGRGLPAGYSLVLGGASVTFRE